MVTKKELGLWRKNTTERQDGREEGEYGKRGEKRGRGKRWKKIREENKEDTQLNCHSEVGVADQERLDDGGQEGGGGLGPSGPGTNAASVGVIRVVVVGNGDVNADAEVAQVDVEVHPGLGLVLIEPGEEGFPVSKGGSGTRVAGFREDRGPQLLEHVLHRSDDEVVAANGRARSFLTVKIEAVNILKF